MCSIEIPNNAIATAARHLEIAVVREGVVRLDERPCRKSGRHNHRRALRRKEVAALPREVVAPRSPAVALNSHLAQAIENFPCRRFDFDCSQPAIICECRECKDSDSL